MILKIERYPGIKKDQINQDWWMLDDIRKISKTTFRRTELLDEVTHNHDIMILDYENIQYNKDTSTDCEAKDWNTVVFVCRRENGEEFSIIYDTIAYILNDSGKTIEKVVANYKE